MTAERISPERHPRETAATLGRAYWAFYDGRMRALRETFLPWVDTKILEAIENRAAQAPKGRVAEIHAEMLAKLSAATLATDQVERDAFRMLYEEADRLIFPATAAFLRHAHDLLNFTRNHSLGAIDLNTIREIDVLGHSDPTYGTFVKDLSAKLGPNVSSPDIVAYSQFFEIYGEAVTLKFLRSRPGLQVARIPETAVPTPDFRCMLDNGPEFYIEVKSLDIVGGSFRHNELMLDGIDTTVELQRQQAAGRRIAVTTTIVDPYRKIGDKDYDARSLIRVIDTLRNKCRSAFKPQQFSTGPTFALAVTDRLIIPGGRNALAPSYYEPFQSGACVSGVLWHTAYGTIGTPIFRPADFEGRPTLEGRLSTDGLYTDGHQLFPGIGMIVLATDQGERKAWGLLSRGGHCEKWGSDEITAVLNTICETTNDEDNSSAWLLSHPDYPNGAPAKVTTPEVR